MSIVVYDKIRNYYPNGVCSTLQEALNHTKKIMNFLKDKDLLSEEGIQAYDEWNSNSVLDSTLVNEEGNNLLAIYYGRYKNSVDSVSNSQEKVSKYWNNRLNDLRDYNKNFVMNESSFFVSNNNKKKLRDFLEFVDGNVSGNTRHILFECDNINGKFFIKSAKCLDKDLNKISVPIFEKLAEGYVFCDDEEINFKDTCKVIKNVWNEESRIYNYDIKIQPNYREKLYFKVQ